jgi:DNA-binding MarR family transcriptional regulator
MTEMKKPFQAPAVPSDPTLVQPAIAFYEADRYLPEESMGYLMRRILTMVSSEVERQLEPIGLTNAQWLPLYKLSIGKASTVAELACESQVDAGAMTRLLDRLEAKGLCQRVRSLSDRRVVNIELTEAGRQAAAGIPAVLSQVQNTHLAGFSAEEFEALKGFLRRIYNNAQASSVPPISTGGPHEA